MRWFLTVTIAASLAFPCHANDFSLNDCIINGMKGVTSNYAAHLVRKACEDKQEEHRQQLINALNREWGDEINTSSVAKAKVFDIESAGNASIEITNSARTPERTLTYIKLSVMPSAGDNQPCDPSRTARYAYKLTLKPESSIKLVFPSNAKAVCTSIEDARGRPVVWKDFSLTGSVQPLDKDPFSDPALIPPNDADVPAPAAAPAKPYLPDADNAGHFDVYMVAAGDFSEIDAHSCYKDVSFKSKMNRKIARCLYSLATKDGIAHHNDHIKFRKWLPQDKKDEIASVLGLPKDW